MRYQQPDISDVIEANREKEETKIQFDPEAVENKKRQKRLNQKEVINTQVLYCIDAAKRVIRNKMKSQLVHDQPFYFKRA